MTEMQAAIGNIQLARLDRNNERRRESAAFYKEMLRYTKLTMPTEKPGVKHVYHNFPMLVPQGKEDTRDGFVEAVRAENVPIDVCYPLPLYRTRLFSDPKVRKGPLPTRSYPCYSQSHCPVSEDAASRVVNIYTDPVLDEEIRSDIVMAVRKVAEHFYGI